MKATHTDEVLAKLSQKEKIYFEELVDRYADSIRRYIARMIGNWQESEDVTQEVFLRAYLNISSFNVKLKFSSWLFRIAHNESVNYIKKHYKYQKVEFNDEIKNKLLDDKNILEKIVKDENREKVIKALTDLPERDREILQLFYFEEKTYLDISDILQISVNSVGPVINRAKIKLKKIFNALK